MSLWKISLRRKLHRMKRHNRKYFRVMTLIALIITIGLVFFGQRMYNEKLIIKKENNGLEEINMYAEEDKEVSKPNRTQ